MDFIAKIINGVNIFIFIWMVLGVYFALRQKKLKDKRKLYLFFAVTGFMVAWRVAIRIITSRYSVALIIPFVIFAAFFLVKSGKKKHVLVTLTLCVFVICTFAIYAKMTFDSVSRYHYSTIASDVVKKFDETRKNVYVIRRAEYTRLTCMSATKSDVRTIKDSESFCDYSKKEDSAHPPMIVYYQVKKERDPLRGVKKAKPLVSMPQNENGTKKQIISFVSSSHEIAPVSETEKETCLPNLREKGDSEEIRSRNESFHVREDQTL